MPTQRFRYCFPLFVLPLSLSLVLSGFAKSPPAQETAPTDFKSLAESASVAREAGKADDAIRDYQQALAIHADWEEGWWYLGTLEYDGDHFAAAIPALQKVVQLNATQGAAWTFLGLCEFETRDYEHSLADLQKGQDLGTGDDPEVSRVAQYHLALLLNRSGEFDKASAILDSSLAQQASPQIKVALGLALLRVPLLPQEVDPSQDALVAAAGETAAILARGDKQRTQNAFRALLHDFPSTPYLHYACGVALASAGENAEALRQQREEVRLSPDSPLPKIEIRRLERALQHSQEPRTAEGTPQVEAPLSVKPPREARIIALYGQHSASASAAKSEVSAGSSDDDWNLAMAAYEEGRYADAIAALKLVVERKPSLGTAWAVMGLSEFELKDYQNAFLHLERGQELGMGGSEESVRLARYRLAILLNRNGRFENARDLLAPEAVKPNASDARFALGLALLRIPSLPGGVEESKHKLVASAGEIAALLQQSKYDAALPAFQTLLQQYPAAPFLHYAYGTALASLSQYDEAESEFRRELTISPSSELPLVRLAAIKLRVDQPGEALPFARRAVELAPESAEAHYMLGRSFLGLGQEAAVQELEVASKMAPGSPEVHFNLAKAYARAKLPDKEAQERATFSRLNALAEQERSTRGDPSYGGSRDTSNFKDPGAEPAVPAQR